MRASRASINIDRLKVCFLADTDFADRLNEGFMSNPERTIDMGDYVLQRGLTDPDRMTIYLYITMDGTRYHIGHYTIHLNGRYQPYVFFECDNKALYTEFNRWEDEKCNLASLIEDISADLGLRYNNITSVELALDTTVNVVAKVRKAIKDVEQYDMVVNWKKETDPYRIIPGYYEMRGGSRQRMSYIPTLYFRQKRDDGLRLKIYNKTAEMATASPQKEKYVTEWNDIPPTMAIYRAEVTIRNEDIKIYCRDTKVPLEEALYRMLYDEKWRDNLWAYSAGSVLHFRNKETDERVDILDLCS